MDKMTVADTACILLRLRLRSGSDPVVERSRNHCIPVPLLFSSYASPYPLPILSLSSPYKLV
ncbi:MAG: hypothetical protein LWX70_08880 [Sphingobacteriia bacterium]|nr:hypothetical protein [Sphingobacteriia bacterium]